MMEKERYYNLTKQQKIYYRTKDYMDRIVGVIGLIVASPAFLGVCIAIKKEEGLKAPLFFKQKRVGKDQELFELYKFRSMSVSTPKDIPTHLLKNPEKYITRVGKFIRKYSLDELPQFLNIIKGEMSVCGPRPALWNQEDLNAQREAYGVHQIKPGLTGWAQIHGRDELEIPEKARLDAYYLRHFGVWIDVKCFFGTILAVVKSDGIVEGGTGSMKNKIHTEICLKNEKRPKILLVANVAKEHVLKFHVPTIKKLSENGWQIDVACSGEETIPYCSKQYPMSYKRSPFHPALLKGILELKQIIDRESYDIVYCHTPVGGVAARLASVKARKKGTKVIYFAHGYHFYKGAPRKNWLLYYSMEKILAKMTDSIILINEEDYNITKEKFKTCNTYLVNGIGVDRTKFQINDPDSIKREYRKDLGIPEDATVLIYLAELLENKNQTLLIDSLKIVHKKHKNVYLVLAGMDHWNGKLQRYAKELNLENYVKYLGWRNDVGNLYTMADICTASSIREGFGLNLVEAMHCSLPIVASLNRGHQTIIKDGVNGYLVKLNDAQMFAERVNMLIEQEDIREKFLVYNKKQLKKYDSDEIVTCILTILEEHLS